MSKTPTFSGAPALLRGASRRLFMQQASALSLVAGAGAPLALNLLAAGSAAAQSSGGYRAIVCLFMFGGNDSFNTVLATDPSSWAAYASSRGQTGSSIGLLPVGTAPNPGASASTPARLGGVLPIAPINNQGRTFAVHPLLGNLQSMFNTDRRLAIVANVGPLVRPTDKLQYSQASHPRPPRLFSHNDQQSVWQTMEPEGSTVGWGGRMADRVASGANKAVFTAISAAGTSVWLSGQSIRPYQVSGAGASRFGADLAGKVYGSVDVANALQSIARTSQGSHVFENHLAAVADRSILAETTLRGVLRSPGELDFGTPPAPGATYNPSADPKLQYQPAAGSKTFSPLAHQLQVVARLIDAGNRGLSGVQRQVFFVSLGGFDTHSGQNNQHTDLMARVAHALSYFDTALGAIGARDKVTTFTASDFGRTFTSNGDGTDHGWGAHHVVMGGAVRGGDLYGKFPVLQARAPGSNDFPSPDQVRNGALLPTTSVDQLGATLGRWFGLSDADALEVFPNLGNFDPAVRNLGFMT